MSGLGIPTFGPEDGSTGKETGMIADPNPIPFENHGNEESKGKVAAPMAKTNHALIDEKRILEDHHSESDREIADEHHDEAKTLVVKNHTPIKTTVEVEAKKHLEKDKEHSPN